MIEVPEKVDNKVSELISENEKKLVDALAAVDRDIADLSHNGFEDMGSDAVFLDKLAVNPIKLIQEILLNPTGVVRNVESAGKIDYTQMTTSDEFYRLPWALAAAAHVVSENREGKRGR